MSEVQEVRSIDLILLWLNLLPLLHKEVLIGKLFILVIISFSFP